MAKGNKMFYKKLGNKSSCTIYFSLIMVYV